MLRITLGFFSRCFITVPGNSNVNQYMLQVVQYGLSVTCNRPGLLRNQISVICGLGAAGSVGPT